MDGCFTDLHFVGHGCLLLLQWMKEMWTTDPCYRSYGVNGSLCSIIIYLSEVTRLLPIYSIKPDEDHTTYRKMSLYYSRWYSTMCTFVSFCLCCVKVESWCPLLPGRVIPTASKQSTEVTRNLFLYRKQFGNGCGFNLYTPGLPESV